MIIRLTFALAMMPCLSFSQIISVSTNGTMSYSLDTSVNYVDSVDIDNNGLNDFAFTGNWGSALNTMSYGLGDSSIVLNYFWDLTPGCQSQGWRVEPVRDSTMSPSNTWDGTHPSGGIIYKDHFCNAQSDMIDRHFALGFRFKISGQFHYGCFDAEFIMMDSLIIHGWAYNSTPNEPITCNDSAFVISTVGQYESSQQTRVIVYPNPTTGFVTVKGMGNATFEIIDHLGRVVMRPERSSFDVSGIPPGMYFVRVIDRATIRTGKIIIL